MEFGKLQKNQETILQWTYPQLLYQLPVSDQPQFKKNQKYWNWRFFLSEGLSWEGIPGDYPNNWEGNWITMFQKIVRYLRLNEWYDSKVPFVLCCIWSCYLRNSSSITTERYAEVFIAGAVFTSLFLLLCKFRTIKLKVKIARSNFPTLRITNRR